MIGTPADLFLKHGTLITGTWNIVGILDAMPDDENVGSAGKAEGLGLVNGVLGGVLNALAPMAREFGRPHGAYGITPLVIYRMTRR